MRAESEFRKEWEILRSRRERSRRRWRGAVAELRERARDPLGLGSIVRAHPIASAGVGAAAGAVIGGFLIRGFRGPDRDAADAAAAAPAPAPWKAALRDAAIGVAMPWVLRFLKEKLGDFPSAPPPDRDPVPSPTKEIRS